MLNLYLHPLLMLNVKQESCKYRLIMVLIFDLTCPGIELNSTVLVADAPSAQPLIGHCEKGKM